MPHSRSLLCLLAILAIASRAGAQPERDVVIENRPLTAIGQHTPCASSSGKWYSLLSYAVRPDGALGQDLYVRSLDGATERRLTSSSVVYHPTWRKDGTRLVFVAIPDRITPDRKTGIYQLSATGESEPVLIMAFSRGDIPFAPTVSPDDRNLAYIHYSNASARATELWVYMYSFERMQLTGELPHPEDGFRLSEDSGPWWHGPKQLRVLGERVTERGVEAAVYECDIVGGKWKRVFRLPDGERASSFAESTDSGRLAYLRECGDPSRLEVVLCRDDGRDPYALCTIDRPLRHIARVFPNDISWVVDQPEIIVASGPNLALLRLGKEGEGSLDACKANMLRLYSALQQYAYDHEGLLPNWSDNPEAFGPPGRDPYFWVAAIAGAYLPDASALYCGLDDRDKKHFPTSYLFNLDLAGKTFDNERQKKDVIILQEAGKWHKEGRLTLYTNGESRLAQDEGP